MFKTVARADYKGRRRLVSDVSLARLSKEILRKALSLPIWQYDYYHIFLPITRLKEVDTHPILSELQKRNKHIALSKVVDELTLKHYLFTKSTELITNQWNIPEPASGIEIHPDQLDVIFLPLLAFDKKGNRVGYGKGFYDRFLNECGKDVIKIGLSLFAAEDCIEDIHESDIKMDYCITPDKIYSFAGEEGSEPVG